MAALSIMGSAMLGYVLCKVTGNETSGVVGGCMTAMASTCVWASMITI